MHDSKPSNYLRYLRPYTPKLWSVLRAGYRLKDFRHDSLAGLTVAVVALPLAMALAIASGTTPEKGLHTAIIAGFLISFFGGSKVQIGGPTAAFIPVVFVVIEKFGFGGMILATLLAGLILIAAGLARFGTWMRYIPRPVVVGFTAGIAVSIFSSQIKDALGLEIARVPAEFFQRWQTYWTHLSSFDLATLMCALSGILVIFLLRKYKPQWPGFLIVVILASLSVSFFSIPIDTIGSRFGGIPSTLPQFEFPVIPFERTFELLPASLTIAFLAGVESLLSAVVADGMIGGRHRPNAELVAQGFANVGSALFGGLPATGAIARTATNVRAGARSPVAGILHALFLLLFILIAAPLIRFVPLAVLASVLLVVAWNMAEFHHIKNLMRGPLGDRLVLIVTFILTFMFDLTIAIEVGVVMAAFLFMHRMGEAVEIESTAQDSAPSSGEIEPGNIEAFTQRELLPQDVEVFQISGPLFFAVGNRLDDVLDQMRGKKPRVFILRLRLVPMIDSSGAHCLEQFLDRAQKMGFQVIFSGLQAQPRAILRDMGLLKHKNLLAASKDFFEAIEIAKKLSQ